jgi:peptide/nickel transport system ATP-binding protein
MSDRDASSPGVSGEAVLEVEALHTEFHLRRSTVRAVDGVSFAVGAGECVGLVGESGCGKSTTALSIMKLLPNVGHITGGSISLLGRDIVPLGEREMRQMRGNDVGMIFQDPMTSLNPTWTIGRQIAEPVILHRGSSAKKARERALEVLELVGMPRPEERLDYFPHQLSGGLRQRVMIAMALACEPKLLIADEPTTALDVTIQAQILDLIDDLRERLHMAVILITHDMGVIAARASRVLVMYAGKIIESAATDELFARMRHPYSEALFDSIPRLDQDRTKPLFSIPGLPPDLSRPPSGCRFSPRCLYATQLCVDEEPPLGARAEDPPDHLYACFHPVGIESPSVVPAESARAHTPLWAAPAPPTVTAAVAGEQPVLLKLDHVVKEYPISSGAVLGRRRGVVHAVSDVSFAVHERETFGLVGESGCGKTTIGRLVVTLERPTAGTVRFGDEDLGQLKGARLRSRRRDLQLMFQDPYASLDPRMRVGAIVEEPLVVQGIATRAERRRRVEELLGEVGLPARAIELYPHEFSGGQRQRIGLARALALQPRLIVADEPVSALDVSIQAQILNLMRNLQNGHGMAYIVISHDLAVLRYLANRIGVMYLGKLVEVGDADEIYEHAAHPYTQGLIDTIPVPDPHLARERRGRLVRGELPSAINPPSGCRFRTRCPLAQQVCAEVEPPLRAFGPGHGAACHFPLQSPTSDQLVELSAGPAGSGA